MSFFNGGFDANKVEPQSFDPLPEGEYIVIVERAEEKLTKDKEGVFLNLRLKVVDGNFKNRTVFKNLNLKNKSPQAQAIGHGELSALCRAIGVMQPRNSFELCNRPIKIKVRHKPDRAGNGMVNDVAAFLPLREQQVQVAQVEAAQIEPVKAPWAS